MFGSQLSFTQKVVLLCLSTVAVTAGSISIVTFQTMRASVYAEAEANLGNVARLNAELIARPFKEMEDTAMVMSAATPFVAIVRAREPASEVPDVDTPTEEHWRRRIETIFTTMMRTHATYTHMRFVGLSDGGREIVHVRRTEEGLNAVPHKYLQHQGTEPYMERLTSASGPFFVSLDHGMRNEPDRAVERPKIRLVHPIQTESGANFGAIVIDADYESLLSIARQDLAPGYQLTILDEHLDYIMIAADGQKTPLQLRADPSHAPSPWGDLVWDGTSCFFLDDDTAAYHEVFDVLSQKDAFQLSVVASVPRQILMGTAMDALRQTYTLAICLAVGMMMVAWRASIQMTRPLNRLISRIQARNSVMDPVELEVEVEDEIGQLAHAYTELANELIDHAGQSMTILKHAPEGILMVEENGTIASANPAAHKIFGYRDGQLIGRNIRRLIPKEGMGQLQQHLEQATGPDAGHATEPAREMCGLRKNTERFPLDASFNMVISSNKTRYMIVLRDISIRKAQEHSLKRTIGELARAHRELERSNQELDQFAYIASHDLKAPLRVIDNTARWLEQDLDPYLDDDTRESMQLLRSRIKRMEQLLNDLLQHSRIGREKVSTKVANGRAIMNDVIELAAIPDTFTIDIDPAFDNLELQVMPLQTVLLNLVRNAVKHHDRAEGHISVSVEDEGAMLAFTVTDDGPGIDPQYHEKAFQMFQTLKPRDQVEGSGIGLAVVKKTVELAGGTICLCSRDDRGCCFRFTWPKIRNLQLVESAAA